MDYKDITDIENLKKEIKENCIDEIKRISGIVGTLKAATDGIWSGIRENNRDYQDRLSIVRDGIDRLRGEIAELKSQVKFLYEALVKKALGG